MLQQQRCANVFTTFPQRCGNVAAMLAGGLALTFDLHVHVCPCYFSTMQISYTAIATYSFVKFGPQAHNERIDMM